MDTIPLKLSEANNFVKRLHRHHKPVQGHKFSIGAVKDGALVGVCIVGRPVSRMRDDGATLEVTRLCTDGTRNACSFLYGAAQRAAFALGFRRIGTYTLPSEGGASLRAVGWKLIGKRGGGSWSRTDRPRTDGHPTEQKLLWEVRSPEPNGSYARDKNCIWRVHYHGDGGQACVNKSRDFSNEKDAKEFAGRRRNELGHYCRDSVRTERIETQKTNNPDGLPR